MANTYFIADTHFEEPDVFFMAEEDNYSNHCTCDFKDDELVYHWNQKVEPEDTVFILGDFGKPSYASKLNGHKILIVGNHDDYNKEEYKNFDAIYNYPILFQNFFILSHEPIYIPNKHSCFANVFGHVHNNPIYKTVSPRSYCVSACRIGYTPVLYEDILKAMKEEEEKND